MIEKHFQTIRELEIIVSSEMLVAILESCPLLEVLKSGKMFARDIVAGSPWACSKQLRVLALAIEFETLPTGEHSENYWCQSEDIYKRLSCLVKIESLRRSCRTRN